ncbi:UDP-N-acetylglucosamine transferase subunit ALG14 [Achlya hypogyna]|uniref:UDP-N-acetylglucosamine transferase subunit ALG14 n=1 Tax=Achlya hypogyna TaxID=1202772 RepID=A0A1V9YB24_ACHHY|nr:UDP-N-acetylglucosamine transferase subunit ALG14 [Achlya hypogyna]
MWPLIAIGALLVALAFVRFWCILPARIRGTLPRKTTPSDSFRTLVVLGSGGHTTEMLKLIKRLQRSRYTPLAFVVAATDHTSREKAKQERQNPDITFFEIPRSREVGQSWITTVFSTAKAFLHCMIIVLRYQPDLLLCNGPGTCIPLCAAVLLLRFVGLKTDAKIIFCESFARVTHLSLSGKLLYPVVDEFVVHWPQLQAAYPRSRYLGVLC